MTKYSLLGDLTESRMFPSKKTLDREDFETLSETTYLLILALRILLTEDQVLAHRYVKRTIQTNNFKSWRTDGTDLYICLHALSTGHYEAGRYPETISVLAIQRWLKEMSVANATDETETRKLFLRMDRLLFVKESSMLAVRRLIMDWPDLDRRERKLSTTRLLQMLRARAQKADILPMISGLAREEDWELKGVCNAETEDCGGGGDSVSKGGYRHAMDKDPGGSFLAGLAGLASGAAAGYALTRRKVKESDGATTSASIASVTTPLGGLGPGFAGPGGDKGIYQDAPVLRRGAAPKKK